MSNLLLYSSARSDITSYQKVAPEISVVPNGTYPEAFSEKMALVDQSVKKTVAPGYPAGAARVYVYRPASRYMNDRDVDIVINGKKIATLKDGYHTVIPVGPGSTTIETEWAGFCGIRAADLKMTAEDGATYYVRVSLTRSKPLSSSSLFTSMNMMLHGGAIYSSRLYLEKEKSETIRFESTFFSDPLQN